MKKDFLVIGSDSGRIVILEFDKEKKCFVKIVAIGDSGVGKTSLI